MSKLENILKEQKMLICIYLMHLIAGREQIIKNSQSNRSREQYLLIYVISYFIFFGFV